MEAFSLLKYWRGGSTNPFTNARTTTTTTTDSTSSSSSPSATTTIVTTVSPRSSNNDDDGPFFDLQFTQFPDETQNSVKEKANLQEEGGENHKKHTISETINIINVDDEDDDDDDEDEDEDEQEQEVEVNDQNISVSPPPSDGNLFFKGSFVPIEPSSLLEGNAKFPISLSKSAAKFRVLMLKFKKSKENISTEDVSSSSPAVNEKESLSRKFFAVKFIKDSRKMQKSSSGNANNAEDENDKDEDDNKFLKDVMQKYLKMVKPLQNIRVSKLKFSGHLMSFSGTAVVRRGEATAEGGPAAAAGSNVKSLKRAANLSNGLGLRVVCKHLGKSKSASLATSGAAGAVTAAPSASRRRDDSLLLQQDGIQSAILHCKRSFNASRDVEVSILSRSASDPSNEKSSGLPTEACRSSEEAKVD